MLHAHSVAFNLSLWNTDSVVLLGNKHTFFFRIIFSICIFVFCLLLIGIYIIPRQIFIYKPVLETIAPIREIENKNFQDTFIVKDSLGLYKITHTGAFSKFYDNSLSTSYELQADRVNNTLYFVNDLAGEAQHTISSCALANTICIPSPVIDITPNVLLASPYFDLPQTEKELLHRETIGLTNIHLSPNDQYLSFDIDGITDLTSSAVDRCIRGYPMIYNLHDATIKPVIRNPLCSEDSTIGGESWLNASTMLLHDGATDQTLYTVSMDTIPATQQQLINSRIKGYTNSFESLKPLAEISSTLLMEIATDTTTYSLVPSAALQNSLHENIYLLGSYPTILWMNALKGIFIANNQPLVVLCSSNDICNLSNFSTKTNTLSVIAQEIDHKNQTVNLGDIVYTIDRLHFTNGMTLVHIADNQPNFLGNQEYVNHYFLVDSFHTIFENIVTTNTFMSSEPAYF